MSFSTLSLRARSLMVTLVALLCITPLVFFALDRAYSVSLVQATFQQLKLNALMLISEFEFVESSPQMPMQVFDEKLNLTDSGVYAYITWQDDVVWQSASSIGMAPLQLTVPPEIGGETFVDKDNYFIYIYTAEYENNGDYSPVHFYVFYDQSSYSEERAFFISALRQWLLILVGLLLVCLILGIMFLLKPLRRLSREIGDTSSGKQPLIEGHYPNELKLLTSSINHLITTEKQQRERYKNSLSDLAHSLKTPLTVAMGEARNRPQLQQPLQEIEAIIQRQLKRAEAQGPGWNKPIQVKPQIDKLLSAMQKVYSDKQLKVSSIVLEDVMLSVESTDLMECIGNVLDNACKAAESQVLISTELRDEFTEILIDDDGPGIDSNHKDRLLTRGLRLDTYHEGQGIGMAVVSDIMASYGGKLAIEKSPWQGARIRLRFPRLQG